MAVQRSPNYPRFDLATAVELTEKLYERERRAPFPVDSAAVAWGYKSTSGSVRVRMGALRQYGLITRGGKESQLTDRALTLVIRNPASRQHQDALREAALFPSLFREIYETRLNASDDTIAHYLIMEKNFTPDGAERFIKSFRATMGTAGLTGEGTLIDEDGEDFDDEEDDDSLSETSSPLTASPSHPVTPTSPVIPEGFISLPIPLDANRIVTVVMPIEMNESEWQRFDRVLKGFRPLSSEQEGMSGTP